MDFLRQKILKLDMVLSSVAQGCGNMPLLALCSDACKGLKNAMNNVFPHAEKRECFRHLIQNYIKIWQSIAVTSSISAISSIERAT